MLSVTHQWTIHHALAINPHDASLFAIQSEQGNAITQKIRWVVLAKAGTLTDPCRLTAVFLNRRAGTGPWHQLYRAARGLRKLQYATRLN